MEKYPNRLRKDHSNYFNLGGIPITAYTVPHWLSSLSLGYGTYCVPDILMTCVWWAAAETRWALGSNSRGPHDSSLPLRSRMTLHIVYSLTMFPHLEMGRKFSLLELLRCFTPGTWQALNDIGSLLPFTSRHSFNKLCYFKHWNCLSCIPTKLFDGTWREGNSYVKWMLHVHVATKWQVYFDDAHSWGKQENFAIKITLRTSLNHSRKAACYSGFLWFTTPHPTSLLALLSQSEVHA